MEAHESFTAWAIDQGVYINGIAPHRFSTKGLGIIAEKDFKDLKDMLIGNAPCFVVLVVYSLGSMAGEILLTVPVTALRTADTVQKEISKAIGSITVHGLLAAELSLDATTKFAAWKAVLPVMNDFRESMPMLWDATLQSLLPKTSQKLLENQKRKLSQDWSAVSKAFPDLQYNEYLYNWLIVNTRTFYFVQPKSKKKIAPDDCMALNPFADYFNHSSSGCEVSFSVDAFMIRTCAPIKKGSEIHISYGSHSNDFLLVEYGFIFDSNTWDEISLDQFIIPLFSKEQRRCLEDAGFLGNYVLDRTEICYRTQVALRILCLTPRKWQRFVDGVDDGEDEQQRVNQLLARVLRQYKEYSFGNLECISKFDFELSGQKILNRRWEQIHLLLQTGIDRIHGQSLTAS